MIRSVFSSGGLVVRARADRLEGLMVSNHAAGPWQLPKGMTEPGESLEDTALREVHEESGCRATLHRLLGTGEWDYTWGGRMWHEICHYFLLTPASSDLDPHDEEFLVVSWVPLESAAMRYDVEQAIVHTALRNLQGKRGGVSVANGTGLWGDLARGHLVWDEEAQDNYMSAGRSVILLRETLAPPDAELLAKAAGIVTHVGGPTSHLAVVAAGLHKSAISGVRFELIGKHVRFASGALVAQGSLVTIDPKSGDLCADLDQSVAPVGSPGNAGDSQEIPATAERLAAKLGIRWTGNWKFFKRDLAASAFPAPSATRLDPGWSAESVLSVWQSYGRHGVRVSVFPVDIACHALSVLLEQDREAALRQILGLERSSALEVFVQQPTNHLAFRLALAGQVAQAEAGFGQAMYLFEAERGLHAVSRSDFHLDSVEGLWTTAYGADEATNLALDQFLKTSGAALVQALVALASRTDSAWMAIEGYFNPATRGWIVCDMDLPADRALMGSGPKEVS